jgi:hypothetical protein
LTEQHDVKHGGVSRALACVTLWIPLLGSAGRSFLDPKLAYGTLRSGLWEKAAQLRPFASLGVPMIIVVANPSGGDVMLDDHHIIVAMFGNPSVRFSIDRETGSPVAGTGMSFSLEDYGVFRSPVREDGRVIGWENRHPHVSAVAVVHERLRSADWREEILRQIPARDRSLEAAIESTLRGLKAVDEAVAAGKEPQGAYRWVEIYELDGDDALPVPAGWFRGERDRRHGLRDDGSYGPIAAAPEQASDAE